jgi:hypothetical protein
MLLAFIEDAHNTDCRLPSQNVRYVLLLRKGDAWVGAPHSVKKQGSRGESLRGK